MDEAARRGFCNGAFEDNEEDVSAIVEEFVPIESAHEQQLSKATSQPSGKPSLAEKLEAQHQSLNA